MLNAAASGNGPGLVLLHPVGLDHSFWGDLPARLAERHRVLAIDHRGHGVSPPASKGLRLVDYAGDVAVLMEHHGMSRAVIIGLSFGGMIAQEFAIRYPDRVTGLVLCGCPGAMPEAARPAIRERGLLAEREGMASIVEATVERWFNAAFRADPAVARVRERLITNDVVGWSAAWHAIAEHDALPRLAAIRAPALVISGERDVATSQEASALLAAAIPGARLSVLAGAPHMMQIETAAAYGDLLIGFLDQLAAPV